MNRRYVIFFIGAVVLLVAGAWLIYIVCTLETNEDAKFQYRRQMYISSTKEIKINNTTVSVLNTEEATIVVTTSTKLSTRKNTAASAPKETKEASTSVKMILSTTLSSSKSTFSSNTMRTEFDTIDCANKSNPFNYIRDAKTKKACILTNMSIQINLQYTIEDSQKKQQKLTNRFTLIVPRNAKTTGSKCGEKMDNMILSWKKPVKTQTDNNDKENIIVFHNGHNNIRFFLDFISVDVHLDDQNFPSAKQKKMSVNTRVKQLFSTSVKHDIFVCKVNNIINIGNQIVIIISDVRLIAFNQCSNNCSRTENNCITDINIGALVGAIVIGIVLLLLPVVSFLTCHKKKSDFTVSENSAR